MNDELRLVGMLVGLCALGMLTAVVVGSMTAQAFVLPWVQ
jgi:hypothetical protein